MSQAIVLRGAWLLFIGLVALTGLDHDGADAQPSENRPAAGLAADTTGSVLPADPRQLVRFEFELRHGPDMVWHRQLRLSTIQSDQYFEHRQGPWLVHCDGNWTDLGQLSDAFTINARYIVWHSDPEPSIQLRIMVARARRLSRRACGDAVPADGRELMDRDIPIPGSDWVDIDVPLGFSLRIRRI